MPSLKDLKNKIASVKNTRKITKAMQMVSAAKLRRAQDAAEAARPYAERMSAVMAGLAAGVANSEGAPKLLVGNGSDKVHLLVVMTAERGLCGGFNSTIVRLARTKANELLAAGKTVKILTVGKKGREQLRRDLGAHFVGHIDLSEVKRIGYANAQNIARDILARFDERVVDEGRGARYEGGGRTDRPAQGGAQELSGKEALARKEGDRGEAVQASQARWWD